MKHVIDPAHPHRVGLFVLDGTEKVREVADAVAARREEVSAAYDRGEFPASAYVPAKWPSMPKYSGHKPGYRKPKPVSVAPGDGVLRHEPAVTRALEWCSEAGVEFWSLAPNGKAWAVRDGEFVSVDRFGSVTIYKPEQ